MIRETYKGRKLTARKGREWGTTVVTCNGEYFATPSTYDQARALEYARNTIDFVDREPVNGDRWPAHYYAPGSYEMCPEGIHPQEIGGQCLHSTCKRKTAQAVTG
jgi:hypothetical protein